MFGSVFVSTFAEVSGKVTNREKIRGIMSPLVMVSTRMRNGMMDRTLWWEENGVNQCTARLCTQTTRTRMLIGRTQSISVKIEWA